MSYPAELDAQGLHQWAARTVEELTRRRADINSLNVFPVPDSDTGSNMLHTMESALEEADKCTDPTAVAEALAIGSVRGARGNSGMVLSQVLRGVADATTQSRIDGHVLAAALGLAVDLVDRALATPVEGTIITVLRAAAEAAKEASLKPHAELYGIAVRALEAARVALENTPSQLPALREAGVVDAGGAGLVILLECLLAQLTGEQPAELPLRAGGPEHSAVAQVEETDSAQAAEIEVVFFYEGDLGALEEALKTMGNSLVIARSTEESGSVHIHSANAGAVIEKAFSLGSVSGLRLEALPAGGADHAAADPHGSDQRRIFAVAPEGAAGELFAKVGADVVKPGVSVHGESDRDLFLPNGFGGEAGAAAIIPTHSLVAGLAAMSVYEPGNPDTAEVVAAMGDAATSMRVVHPAAEKADAVETACATLLAQGGEQVTVLTGLDLGEEDLAARLGVDVAVLRVPGLRTEIGVE
ncbi:DAK2 domain-containing protein [Corynebacterium sp.]|uniref:DAK2 domain-containing protein n=1 Tax=Corynebacterium sp. TaxID=1720 RepID=UPI0027B8EE43|nr:DAK2 domain-containing protein [Corynebacterium sp.]